MMYLKLDIEITNTNMLIVDNIEIEIISSKYRNFHSTDISKQQEFCCHATIQKYLC